jgi:hypothetical protein
MEINASGDYYQYLMRNDDYYFYIPLFGIFFRGGVWALSIPFWAYIIRSKAISTFTNSMKIGGDQLVINYKKFFMTREKSFPIAGTILELRNYHDDARFPSYYKMAVVINKKTKYVLDSREGFTKETLLSFMSAFSGATFYQEK